MATEPKTVNGYKIEPRANLSWANLSKADLSGANLSWANLSGANLSGAKGLIDPADYLNAHFERDPEGRGFLTYKVFGKWNPSPADWKIEPGSIITEIVCPDRCTECGSGINVATRKWLNEQDLQGKPIWRCLIRWEWLPGVIVPFMTDGKIRCGKVELLKVVDDTAVAEKLAGGNG